jgi:hypothetical protein
MGEILTTVLQQPLEVGRLPGQVHGVVVVERQKA